MFYVFVDLQNEIISLKKQLLNRGCDRDVESLRSQLNDRNRLITMLQMTVEEKRRNTEHMLIARQTALHRIGIGAMGMDEFNIKNTCHLTNLNEGM